VSTPLSNYSSRAVRALVLLHDVQLRDFFNVWQQARAVNVQLSATDDLSYRSLEHLLEHVLWWAGEYVVDVCRQLNLPDPQVPPLPPLEQLEAQGQASLEQLLAWWRLPMEGVTDADLELGDDAQDMLDSQLEHAVVHPLRHAFQLRELLGEQE
jgi:hypothetical protein